MGLDTKGKVVKVLEVESGTSKAGKEWKKQGFVINNDNEFNPEICFSVFGEDKLQMVSELKVGEEVTVHFNLSSREFNSKYYHSIDAWRIEKVVSEQVAETVTDDLDDTLPF